MLKVKIYSACDKIGYIIVKAANILGRCLNCICTAYLCIFAISEILYFTRGITLPFDHLHLTWGGLLFVMLFQMYLEKAVNGTTKSYEEFQLFLIKKIRLYKAEIEKQLEDARKTDQNN